MKCNYTNPQKYKKSFFKRIAEFFDSLIGIKPEDYMSDEEAEEFEKSFDRVRSYKKKCGKKGWYLER
jgi:hypothetical protein